MLAISTLGATPTAILYAVAVILFVLAGLGQAFFGEKINLIGFGLAAYVFVAAWNAIAAT